MAVSKNETPGYDELMDRRTKKFREVLRENQDLIEDATTGDFTLLAEALASASLEWYYTGE